MGKIGLGRSEMDKLIKSYLHALTLALTGLTIWAFVIYWVAGIFVGLAAGTMMWLCLLERKHQKRRKENEAALKKTLNK